MIKTDNLKTKPNFRIPVTFQRKQEEQSIDGRFAPVIVKILHTGLNYNGSIFTKEVVNEALKSLEYVPILAYIEPNQDEEIDFSDHRYKIEKIDGEYHYKYLGVPVGFISSNHNARWEFILGSDGVNREYLVAEGILWTRFEESMEIFGRDKVKSQSMELLDKEGTYDGFFDENNYYNFTKFTFDGLCCLGKDYQPAMHDSSIKVTLYSMESLNFEIQEMMEQYKQYIFQQNQSDDSNDNSVDINTNFTIQKEGGRKELNVGEINAILKEYSIKLSDINFEIKDDITSEDFKALVGAFAEKQKQSMTYSATYQQKRNALSNACDSVVIKDAEGKVVSETWYYISDFDDTHVFVEKYTWKSGGDSEQEYGRFEYSFNNEDKTATLIGELEPMIMQWLTLDENAKLEASRTAFTVLQGEFDTYKKNYSTPNTEVTELTNFRNSKLNEERQTAETELFTQFDETLGGAEEYQKLKTNAKDFSLEDIENQCLILFAKENLKVKSYTSFSKQPKTSKIPTTEPENIAESPYGNLFDD